MWLKEVITIKLVVAAQSASPGGVPWLEGEHPCKESWLRLQERVREVFEKVYKIISFS